MTRSADPSKSSRRIQAADYREMKTGIIVAGAVAGVLAIVVVFLATRSGAEDRLPPPEVSSGPARTPPAPRPTEKPVSPTPPANPVPAPAPARPSAPSAPSAAESTREAAAAEALRKAREYQKANPQDFAGQAEIFQQAVWVCERTSHAAEVAQELDAVKKQELVQYQTELAALDREARTAVDREDMKGAFAILHDAEAKHPGAQWKLLVGRKTRDLNDQSWKIFDALKDEALAAQQRGDSKGVEKIRARIARWSFREFADALEKALGQP